MLRSSLSHEKQLYPWPNSLLSARATVTQLSAVTLMNQQQKGDIALTHSHTHTEQRVNTNKKGKTSWYGAAEALPSLAVHKWRAVIDFQQTQRSLSHPSPSSMPTEALTHEDLVRGKFQGSYCPTFYTVTAHGLYSQDCTSTCMINVSVAGSMNLWRIVAVVVRNNMRVDLCKEKTLQIVKLCIYIW